MIKMTMKHIACFACIGKTIEGIHLITPCLRCYEEGYMFPDDCPKKARGVDITSIPKWEEIEEHEFNISWMNGQLLGTKVRVFEDDKFDFYSNPLTEKED